MEREAVAVAIHWTWIMFVVGIINPCFMVPQLVKIWKTTETEGISMITLVLLVLLQAAFSIHGFFIRDTTVMWSSGAAACVSLMVIFSTAYFRRQNAQ